MFYSVKQASVKLNISMQSIYVKIKLSEFKSKIIKRDGKTYIDEDTLTLIKNSLKISNDDLKQGKENSADEETATDSDDSSLMIQTLIQQLKVKDQQINLAFHKIPLFN